MELIWAPEKPTGMIGIGPGLDGGTNGVPLSILYTVFDTTSPGRPRAPLPRWLMTDAPLVLRSSFSALSVSETG